MYYTGNTLLQNISLQNMAMYHLNIDKYILYIIVQVDMEPIVYCCQFVTEWLL